MDTFRTHYYIAGKKLKRDIISGMRSPKKYSVPHRAKVRKLGTSAMQSLLPLPRELRNMIYGHMLDSRYIVKVKDGKAQDLKKLWWRHEYFPKKHARQYIEGIAEALIATSKDFKLESAPNLKAHQDSAVACRSDYHAVSLLRSLQTLERKPDHIQIRIHTPNFNVPEEHGWALSGVENDGATIGVFKPEGPPGT
ncbi:hypothetical protein CC80DRAFT_541871 [Byssothecium circinans]|uniref:Uncharacterized protein n=1 Tax=Byssothecium circinans TaxID=147558 RepID=A0A6A5UG22_9PLEO|nr:hypothetical protein CC80DRAFT_541871 [Byssothecium circinans]